MWRLVAGLVRSLASLADVESLRVLRAASDFHAIRNEQQRRSPELLLADLLHLDRRPMERFGTSSGIIMKCYDGPRPASS